MSAAAPTFSQIKAQVAAIPEKSREGKAIGIRSFERWTDEPVKRDGDRVYRIHQCDSPLAMRIALRQPVAEPGTTVLITPLDEKDLSDDIKLRLAKRRLFVIDSWQIARHLFNARAVDPRLTGHAWIAETLLESVPTGGFPPARAGFLDAETVWPLLLRQMVGMAAEVSDLTSLLKWTLDADGASRFRRASQQFRQGMIAWLSEKVGPVAEVVLHCVERSDGLEAVPLGLAAGIVLHPNAAGKLEKAAGKLEERFLGGESPDAGLMLRWHTAATEVVRGLRHTDARAHRQTLARGDEILRELGAETFAWVSDTSPQGFDQRLAHFGRGLLATIDEGLSIVGDSLVGARNAVRAHDQATREVRRLDRIEMSVRLVRWLNTRATRARAKIQSLAEVTNDYASEGSFVDWARLSLRSDDPVRELAEAYLRLFDEATRVREGESETFARLLRDWTHAGSTDDELIRVECILAQIVAPLAGAMPVLVIVVDGMSVAVCRELLADIARHDWVLLAEEERGTMRPGLAVIPSVTEVSRTSLLSGMLRQGTSADEKSGFAQHRALLQHCRAGSPPILFHKPALQETGDGVLASEVRKEIASGHRRIVGVVVNAVDDHLLKGEQIDTRWTRDEIRILPTLLHEARLADRVVILLADHGHILDCRTSCRAHDEGERWRSDDGRPEADETAISGSRVMLLESQRMIAPWSEKVRYGMKKNGYHGGLSLQEMVVPIAVLATSDDCVPGWTEARVEMPEWWDEAAPELPGVPAPKPRLKPSKPKPTGRLFDLDEDQSAPTPEVTRQPGQTAPMQPEWIARVLASEVFAEQKKLGGRVLPADAVFARLLAALESRGGKATSVTLARTLDSSPLRLRGLLAVAVRVLNVDGYGILIRDEASDTVELNRDLLLRQFGLM